MVHALKMTIYVCMEPCAMMLEKAKAQLSFMHDGSLLFIPLSKRKKINNA